jgi:phosphoglycerol transferase MdoB-like AlkP superfamily enzyme
MVKKVLGYIFRKTIYGIKKLRNDIKASEMGRFRFIIVIDMLVKTILFLLLLQTDSADKIESFSINILCIGAYLSFILYIYSFSYLFSKNKQIIFHMVVSIAYSFLLIIDLGYFRVNKDFIGLKNIFHHGTFNVMGKPWINFRSIDIIFIADIVILFIYIAIKRLKNTERRDCDKFKFAFKQATILFLISFLIIEISGIAGWDKRIFTRRWSTEMSVPGAGPLGYHEIDAIRTLSREMVGASEQEKSDVNKWLQDNVEDIPDNQYAGVLKGKNIIFLQIESLENFVINKEVNGKELTPFLNKLTREGLYFNNFYEQNNAGNSIDCDFMVNSSVYPLGDEEITALNYGENVYRNSLPRLLNQEGYNTVTTHAETIGDFNWTELHKNGFGVKELWDIKQYNYEETVGYGLSDKSFLTQVSGKLNNVNGPFFLQLATLSSHGPYDIDSKYRTLNLPKNIDSSYLGGYFESVSYTDKQIEMFLGQLEANGKLDNTAVVIYGDHGGVHKYYNDEIQLLDYEGNWWKEYDHRIPLIIFSKGITPKVVEASGGQVDMMPTIAYLLGIQKAKYQSDSMGRVLINTDRDATVIKGNNIVGNVKNDEEREHLLNSYRIGETIIRNDFFDDEDEE